MAGVSCVVMLRATGSKKYQTQAMECTKWLKALVALGNPNDVAYDDLLEAESVSLKKHQAAKAVEFYEKAITEAGRIIGRLTPGPSIGE